MPFPFPFSDGPTAPANTHDIGDLVTVVGEWSVPDTDPKVPLDPATVKLSVKDPSGNLVTYEYLIDPEITRVSQGVYRARINADEAGTWYYRWFSEGDGQAAEEQSFTVDDHEAM